MFAVSVRKCAQNIRTEEELMTLWWNGVSEFPLGERTQQKQRGRLTNECDRCFLFRCYNKTNGTFSGGTLPLMHRVAPCQQDGLEMVPLGQVSPQCHGPDGHMRSADQGDDAGHQPDEHKESSPSQHSCCLVGNSENYPADSTGEHALFLLLPSSALPLADTETADVRKLLPILSCHMGWTSDKT